MANTKGPWDRERSYNSSSVDFCVCVACGIEFPDQGLNLGPLHWELRVLTTGPPGKSLQLIIIWEWGLFSKRCGRSGFLCESFQFLNVGTKFFRNTKWAKLNTSVCWNQPMDLQGTASGPDDVWSPFQSGRIWPGGRLSLQSVCFWLPGLFLLQFKQSGRGLKCNCVYKHPKEFHMVCRMWSWLNLKRLNVLRQLQSCLFHKSMQFVGGRPARDELWEAQLVWPVSPVVGTSEASCVTVALLNIQTSSSLQHTHTLMLPFSLPPPPFRFLLLNLNLIQMKKISFTHSGTMQEVLSHPGPAFSTDSGPCSHAEALS